jgi:hypothetical protein
MCPMPAHRLQSVVTSTNSRSSDDSSNDDITPRSFGPQRRTIHNSSDRCIVVVGSFLSAPRHVGMRVEMGRSYDQRGILSFWLYNQSFFTFLFIHSLTSTIRASNQRFFLFRQELLLLSSLGTTLEASVDALSFCSEYDDPSRSHSNFLALVSKITCDIKWGRRRTIIATTRSRGRRRREATTVLVPLCRHHHRRRCHCPWYHRLPPP